MLQCHDDKTCSYSLGLLYDATRGPSLCPYLTRLNGTLIGLTNDMTAIILRGSPKVGQFPFYAVSALTGRVLFDTIPQHGEIDDSFFPLQDLKTSDYVLFPRVAVFKMRGRTSGAQGIFVFRWGLASLSDKPATRFVSKIYDNTCCDLYAYSSESTTLVLCPHGCAYILEFPNLGDSSLLPHWEYPVPHFVVSFGVRDDFLTRWWAACSMAETEVLLQRTIDNPFQRHSLVESALQEMPEVPTEIRAPNQYAQDAIERYPCAGDDTKVLVDCQYVYVLEFENTKQQLYISYGLVGQHKKLSRLDPLTCDVFIGQSTCCNFGFGDASALFLIPGPQKTKMVHLCARHEPKVAFVGVAVQAPTRMARDHHQGIMTDLYRISLAAQPDTST